MPDALTALLDRSAVEEVLIRYATALDTKDWGLLRTCFLDGVVGVYETLGEVRGYDALERMCRQVLEPLAGTQHQLTNVVVTVEGATATATCYLQSTHVRAEPGGDNWVIAGTYSDQLVRTYAGWRIARRSLRRVWTSGRLPTRVNHSGALPRSQAEEQE